MTEKRPQDRCKEAVTYTSEAAELAEYLQERIARESLDPQFDALVELIDKAHGEAFEAEVELEGGDDD